MPERPELQKFLTDPAFQSERDFLEGFMTAILEKKHKEAEAKKIADDASKPKNIFDVLFAGK